MSKWKPGENVKRRKRAVRIIVTIPAIVVLFILAVYINHIVRLHREARLREPIGRMVEVDGLTGTK